VVAKKVFTVGALAFCFDGRDLLKLVNHRLGDVVELFSSSSASVAAAEVVVGNRSTTHGGVVGKVGSHHQSASSAPASVPSMSAIQASNLD
jgi:hypothetical protein